ncbi:MAG: hypothetical protein ABSD32_22020 [Mycobacterium sp.]
MAAPAPANISTIASFPRHFFLENLAVRADGSILVTVLNHKQLWYVPAPTGGQSVTPALLHTFDHIATGIAETDPTSFMSVRHCRAPWSASTYADGSPGHPSSRHAC